MEKAWAPSKPHKLDWRVCKHPRRAELAKELAILNCELIEKEKTLEVGTVAALMGEIEERVGAPPGTVLIEPTVASMWAREGAGEDEPTAEEQAEQAHWNTKVAEASHLLICVHSEGPPHYTYLEVTKVQGYKAIEYRDSMKIPSKNAREAATKILRKLGVIDAGEQCPEPCNKRHQVDGWSCGLWTTRWIERALREIRGEGREPGFSVTQSTLRGNEFILKLQASSDNVAAKAKSKAKGKAKGKATAGNPPKEGKHASLAAAQAAAEACTKCANNKYSKGCRECMGDWFEEVRQRGHLQRAAKELEMKVNAVGK